MNRPLLITKRQAKALIEAAREARGVVDVNPDTGVIRLIPDVLAGDLHATDRHVDDEPEGTM